MTYRQIFIQTIFWGLLVILGLYIAFRVHWTISEIRLLGIFAFFFVGFGSLMFSISLTKLFFPNSRSIDTWNLFDKNKYNEFKKTFGKKFQLFSITYISLWIVIFLGCGYWYYTYTSTYKLRQLQNFNQSQKVRINDTFTFYNLPRQVEFDYYFNDEKYTNRLSSNNIQVGDSVYIYFSTQNPDIVKWDEISNNR